LSMDTPRSPAYTARDCAYTGLATTTARGGPISRDHDLMPPARRLGRARRCALVDRGRSHPLKPPASACVEETTWSLHAPGTGGVSAGDCRAAPPARMRVVPDPAGPSQHRTDPPPPPDRPPAAATTPA